MSKMKSILKLTLPILYLMPQITEAVDKISPPENVINHYIHWSSFPGKDDIVKKSKIRPANVDINKDGKLDWYLNDPSFCGQIGCSGIIYLYTNNNKNHIKDTTFCIAGERTDGSELDYYMEKNKYKNLKCNDNKDQIIEWKNPD